MAYGWWGSRLPIGNMLSSRLVDILVRYRLTSQRARSALRSLLRRPDVQGVNSAGTRDEMRKWLDAGYDRINVGGGDRSLRGFVNIDFVCHPNVDREVVANALDLSFIPSGCISQVHTNHMLEHLQPERILHQLEQYRRILKPGGILTLRVPNTLGAAYAYWFEPILERDRDAFVAEGFPSDETFGDPRDAWLHKDLYGVLHWFYGEIGSVGNEHFTRITPSWMQAQLEAAGFRISKMSLPEALNLVVIARTTP